MVIDKNIVELICELESIVGSECYNPNSYNGWTGEEGCSFRYPVKYCANDDDYKNRILTRTKGKIFNMNADRIGTIKYTFGSNHLYIGDALCQVLSMLEDRYGININKLENERIEKKKSKLEAVSDMMKRIGGTFFDKGEYIVGIDFPVGTYVVSKPEKMESGYYFNSITVLNEDGKIVESTYIGSIGSERRRITLEKGWSINISEPLWLELAKELEEDQYISEWD